MARVALIVGITGQDGSYLAEFLLARDYSVHGIIRRSSSFNTHRIDHLYSDSHVTDSHVLLHYGDLSDGSSLKTILEQVKPDEVYNLGAQSHVRVSFDQPIYTADVCGLGALRLLEAVREYAKRAEKDVRFYQASSSEMFGSTPEVPQRETTAFHPRSPYGCAKVFAYHQTVNYREAYGMHASNGILFNHESPRRGETFVTRKITRAATRVKLGLQSILYLGNLDSQRDWGFAGDYVEAMWLMLQKDTPDDYVVATGESHTVREFLATTFSLLGLDWEEHVRLDRRYLRPSEVDVLRGDAAKAGAELGWSPRVSFTQLVEMMVEADMKLARDEKILWDAGTARTLHG